MVIEAAFGFSRSALVKNLSTTQISIEKQKRKHPKRTLFVARNQQEFHTIDSFLLVTHKN